MASQLTKTAKNYKLIDINIKMCGLIAQLVERCVRNAEARGSNPLKSTRIT